MLISVHQSMQCHQVMANNGSDLHTLAKHSSLSSRKYAAVLSIVIMEFETKFQDCKKKVIIFLTIFVTLFSVSINTTPANFQIEYIDINSKNLNMSLYWTLLR